MFVRPRLSRIWIVLAGGTLLTLFGLAVRRNSSTVLDGGLETGKQHIIYKDESVWEC